MKSYAQYCAVARALDVVGDRWTLLIVRELMLRESCRYTDLREGLPGIATNLLADRLRDLEEAGILRKAEAPPPVGSVVYSLTSRGLELAPVLNALGTWGSELMTNAGVNDEFRTHWITLPIKRLLKDHDPKGRPITIEVRTGDHPLVINASGGTITTREGTAQKPDAVISGKPETVVGVLAGRIELSQARKKGLRFNGSVAALRRLQPKA
ncbi:MAG: winged helix-turn-helix transcriptional regulator [Actinomycetota bacterium]